MTRRTSVILDIRPGERIAVAENVDVQMLNKSGNLVRLRITAPQEVPIKKLPIPLHEVDPSKAI